MNEKNDNIGVLILRYLERRLTGHDLRRFTDWLGANDSHLQEFEQLKSIHDEREPHVDLGDSWSRLTLKIDRQDAARRKVRRLKWLAGIAAALCLLLGAGVLLLRQSATRPTPVAYVTGNSASQLDLPDGSAVRLAPNSRLVYHTDYGDKSRDVTLEGEAFFDVKKDARCPFRVIAPGQTIVVTGTQFNVSCYPDEREFTTTLKQGAIRFSSTAFSKEIDLRPGEQIRFNHRDGSITVRQAALESELAWLESKHVFNNAPLAEILLKMGHVYNCEFNCDDPRVEQMCYTGTFYDTDSLAVFLNVIQTLTGLKATRSGKQVNLHS